MGPETANAKNRGFGVWGETRKNKAGMSGMHISGSLCSKHIPRFLGCCSGRFGVPIRGI